MVPRRQHRMAGRDSGRRRAWQSGFADRGVPASRRRYPQLSAAGGLTAGVRQGHRFLTFIPARPTPISIHRYLDVERGGASRLRSGPREGKRKRIDAFEARARLIGDSTQALAPRHAVSGAPHDLKLDICVLAAGPRSVAQIAPWLVRQYSVRTSPKCHRATIGVALQAAAASPHQHSDNSRTRQNGSIRIRHLRKNIV